MDNNNNKPSRPHSEEIDDIVEWCEETLRNSAIQRLIDGSQMATNHEEGTERQRGLDPRLKMMLMT